MSEFARVTSIEELKDFRSDLCTFGERAKEALSSLQMQIQGRPDGLDDRGRSWQGGVRYWEEAVTQARAELARRKMIRIGDRAPDCTEQEDILRAALRRLDEAEDKLAR